MGPGVVVFGVMLVACSAPRNAGTIDVLVNDLSSSTVVTAIFLESGSADAGCQRSTWGACSVAKCVQDVGLRLSPWSAGEIFVAGSLLGGGLSLAPEEVSVVASAPAWRGPGQLLTVSASGADVPGFSGHSLASPEALKFTGPVGDISRAAPLTVTWMPGAADTDAVVELFDGAVWVSCLAPAGTGELSIPVGATANLPTTAGRDLVLSLSSRRHTDFVVGDWSVRFSLIETSAQLASAVR